MNIDPDKKYAIFHAPYIAIPIERVADVINNAVFVDRNYDRVGGLQEFILAKAQGTEACFITGEEIIASSTAHRLRQDQQERIDGYVRP